MTRLAEIKERLDAATDGPWEAFHNKGGFFLGIGEVNGQGVFDSGFGVWGDDGERERNATFIANAPSDIEWLLDQNTRMREALEVLLTEEGVPESMVRKALEEQSNG